MDKFKREKEYWNSLSKEEQQKLIRELEKNPLFDIGRMSYPEPPSDWKPDSKNQE